MTRLELEFAGIYAEAMLKALRRVQEIDREEMLLPLTEDVQTATERLVVGIRQRLALEAHA